MSNQPADNTDRSDVTWDRLGKRIPVVAGIIGLVTSFFTIITFPYTLKKAVNDAYPPPSPSAIVASTPTLSPSTTPLAQTTPKAPSVPDKIGSALPSPKVTTTSTSQASLRPGQRGLLTGFIVGRPTSQVTLLSTPSPNNKPATNAARHSPKSDQLTITLSVYLFRLLGEVFRRFGSIFLVIYLGYAIFILFAEWKGCVTLIYGVPVAFLLIWLILLTVTEITFASSPLSYQFIDWACVAIGVCSAFVLLSAFKPDKPAGKR